MSKLKFILVSASIISITACGGGGGDGNAVSTAATTNLNGVAIDGYLYNADVCLDINDNFTCDEGEPSATTNQQGQFSLLNVPQDQIATKSILVIARAGTTIDQDNPNQPISFDFKLTAPPGKTVISPLTTLVKGEMLINNSDEETAHDYISTLFNEYSNQPGIINFSLFQDYKYSGNELLSKIAAALISPAWGLTPSDMRLYFESFAHTAVEFVAPNIDEINDSTSIDDAKNIITDAISLGPIDLQNGISDFRDFGDQWYRVRTSIFVPNQNTNPAQINIITGDNYAIQDPNFVTQLIPQTDYWALGNGNWQPVTSTITQTAGNWTLSGGEFGNSGVRHMVEKVNLSGKTYNLTNFNLPDISHTFPNGSNGYYLSYITDSERYILSGNELQPLTISTEPLNKLIALITTYDSGAAPSWTNSLELRNGLRITFTPESSFSGSISIRDADVPNRVAHADGGKYSLTVRENQYILKITEIDPTALQSIETTNPMAKVEYDSGVRYFFAVDPNGELREGVYTPPSVSKNPTLQLNRTALNSMLQALSLCQLNSTFSGNENCPPN